MLQLATNARRRLAIKRGRDGGVVEPLAVCRHHSLVPTGLGAWSGCWLWMVSLFHPRHGGYGGGAVMLWRSGNPIIYLMVLSCLHDILHMI